MITNKDRALKVKKLLGLSIDEEYQEDTEDKYYRVADVIADLRHFCDLYKLDWDGEIRLSEMHYEEEVEDEQ